MKSLNSVILFFAILAVAGAGLFFFPASPFYYKTLVFISNSEASDNLPSDGVLQENAAPETTESSLNQTDEKNVVSSGTMDDAAEASSEEATETISDNSDEKVSPVSANEDGQDPLKKTLGSDDAPVKIIEFSSLSCGHCGHFHEEVYPEIKKNYVETGKVQFVMVDFPLNLPALRGAMVAHCLPEDQYFNFLQLLFTTQDNWLTGDFESRLKQNAQLAGMSEPAFDACLADKELEEQIISRVERSEKKWEISSTPSFIIDNGTDDFQKIVGNTPYEEFSAAIDRALKKAE